MPLQVIRQAVEQTWLRCCEIGVWTHKTLLIVPTVWQPVTQTLYRIRLRHCLDVLRNQLQPNCFEHHVTKTEFVSKAFSVVMENVNRFPLASAANDVRCR